MLKTTPNDQPHTLGKAPLVDTAFEVRFDPAIPNAGQILPSLILKDLGQEYSRTEATPVASIPKEMRDGEETLRYKPHYRLVGDSAVISVGDRIAGVGALPPYQGWTVYRPRIESLMQILVGSDVIGVLERFSLKFTNVLTMPINRQLDLINLDAVLGGVPAPDQGFQYRTELNDEKSLKIVEVRPNTKFVLPGKDTYSGLLVSIDCIQPVTSGDKGELTIEAIEELHAQLKQLFFGILKPDTLEALEPIY